MAARQIDCGNPLCGETFPFNPSAPHRKYHNKTCQKAVNARRLQEKRKMKISGREIPAPRVHELIYKKWGTTPEKVTA